MADRRLAFLDTTVFADYCFGGAEIRNRIRENLAPLDARAAGYVREQFRSTFLRAAVAVFNSLRETRDPIMTLRRTDEFRFFKTARFGVKARKVLCALLGQTLDVDEMLDRLERLIEWDLMKIFDGLVAIEDATGCCICHAAPAQDENGEEKVR